MAMIFSDLEPVEHLFYIGSYLLNCSRRPISVLLRLGPLRSALFNDAPLYSALESKTTYFSRFLVVVYTKGRQIPALLPQL